MKKTLFLLLCFIALHATAENRLYISDFNLDPGDSTEVSIMLDNDVTTFASFQVDMYLPEGLELVEQYNEDDEEYFTFALTTRARSRMAIGSAVQADGAVRLMLTQTIGSSMQTIRDTSGALVTFQIKAKDTATGTQYIDLKNIQFATTSSEKYVLDDTRTSVIITDTPETPTGNRLYIEDFNINLGDTIGVAIMLDNEVTTFASFQADMYLPEGLELVEQYNEDDEEFFTFALTTRARSRMAIGSTVQADGAVRLMLTQTIGSSMQTIRDTSGALVTFLIKAKESGKGTQYIDLKNIQFSTSSSEQYVLNDTRTQVIIGSPSPATGPAINVTSLILLAGTSQILYEDSGDVNVTWSSSNPSVVAVSANGTITGIAPGTATITYTANEASSNPLVVNVILLGDMNQDGHYSISDVTNLVNEVVSQ